MTWSPAVPTLQNAVLRPKRSSISLLRGGARSKSSLSDVASSPRQVREAAHGRSRLVPIAAKHQHKDMSPFIMYPSAENDDSFVEHDGEEFMYVLRGEVEATFPSRKVNLKPGDSIYFDGHVPHRLRSTRKDAAVLIVIAKTR